MNSSAWISERKPYAVRVGDFVMYCERFKAVGTAKFSEQSTVNGETVFSNSGRRALRITVEGRIYDQYLPLRMLLRTDTFQAVGGKINVEYRGLTFMSCQVESFTMEDNGDEYIYASITLLTPDTATLSEVSTADEG